jgi:hypothetical protein
MLGERARVYEILDRSTLRALLRRHLDEAKPADWRLPIQIWTVLMLELWLQNYAYRR